jgi:dihydrofolate reductase
MRARPLLQDLRMPPVLLEISMSLDGFTAGPNVSMQNPMGDGGEALHAWLFGDKTPVDEAIIAEMLGSIGAVIMGRRTCDLGEGPWGDEPPFPVPCFILTHRGRAPVAKKGVVMTFVEGGIGTALDQAKRAAGDRKVSSGWRGDGAAVYEGAADR